MAIRINLLAEAQALEESRRRDPVKRAIWAGVSLVVFILLWSSSLQLKAMIARGEVSRLEAGIASHSSEDSVVRENQKKLAEVSQKLTALRLLAASRFLHGNMLDALQHATVDDVQLIRLKVEQGYALIEATKPVTNGTRVTPGQAAKVTERIALYLDARDSGPNPGDQINVLKQRLAASPYFQANVGLTNAFRLTSLQPPQTGPDGRPFVPFTLECRFPDKTR